MPGVISPVRMLPHVRTSDMTIRGLARYRLESVAALAHGTRGRPALEKVLQYRSNTRWHAEVTFQLKRQADIVIDL